MTKILGIDDLATKQHPIAQSVQRKSLSESTAEVRLALAHELDEVFSLRYDVFLAGKELHSETMLDVDEFDQYADHLIVRVGGRIVATYRVIPSERVLEAGLGLYASHEFDVTPLIERLDPKSMIELGRSCVHPAHRNGAIPKLLWSALAKYMMSRGKTEAVGCVSVFNCSHEEAQAMVGYFRETGAWTSMAQCSSKNFIPSQFNSPDSIIDGNSESNRHFEHSHLKARVPPLLRSYLMLGAKIFGGPAYDPHFHCHDFLMHFSTKTMSERCRQSLFS
jgi:putative hemolysin